jgi:hypothetical protein
MVAVPEPVFADKHFLRSERVSTPIAAALQDHFASGGTAADGVRLVERLERNGMTVSKPGAKTSSAARGSRLPADWRPSEVDVAFAVDRGLPPARIPIEAEKFLNYWTAKSGSGACKRDWGACWRNWILNIVERGYGLSHPRTNIASGRAATGSDAILAGMGRLAARIDERQRAEIDRRQIPNVANATGTLDLEPRRAR